VSKIEWIEKTLGDLIHIKHGWAFKGEYFASDGEYIVVTPGNFFEEGGFRLRIGKEKFYTDKFPTEYLLKKNDLVIAMTEQGEGLLGSPALIPYDDVFLHNQRIGLFQDFDEELVSKEYLYYLFFTQYIRDTIANSSTGTKVRHTAPKSIYKIKVKLPSLKTQTKIASILSSYDELIENNNQRIKLLEEMAEEIYKEWFVRFRFPDFQNVKMVDGIPEEWKENQMKDYGKIVTGKTPSTQCSDNFGGNIPFIKIPDFKQGLFVIDTDETLSLKGANSQKNQFIPANSICISCIGSVGEVAITMEQSQTNQQINTIELQNINNLEYLYFALKKLKPIVEAYAATGATMGNISKGKFEKLKLVKPNDFLLEKFSDIVKPIFEEIKNLMQKNQNLKQTRDLLLPRLISGKLDIEKLKIT